MTRRVVVSIAAAAALACGGSSNGGGGSSTSVSVGAGPYAGTYTNVAAISASGSCSVQSVAITGAIVSAGLSSSGADLCRALRQGAEPANSNTISVSVAKLNIAGLAQAITPGTYPIFDLSGGAVPTPDLGTGTASFAFVTASKSGTSAGTGQGCNTVSSEEAASGTVTITSVTASAVVGTVTATLKNNGGVVNGAFNAPLCAGAYSLGGSCSISGIPSPTSCQ